MDLNLTKIKCPLICIAVNMVERQRKKNCQFDSVTFKELFTQKEFLSRHSTFLTEFQEKERKHHFSTKRRNLLYLLNEFITK